MSNNGTNDSRFDPPGDAEDLASAYGFDGESVAIERPSGDDQPGLLRAIWEVHDGHRNSILEVDGEPVVVDHDRVEVVG